MSYRYTRGDRLLPIEKPEGKLHLQARLEHQQVARFEYMVMPTEEDGFGFELTNYWRVVLFGAEDSNSYKYHYRIVYRAIPAQRIITKRMVAHHTDQRRPDHKRFPERPAGPLQQRIEGEVITGFLPTYGAVQPFGGERVEIEFVGGARLRLTASPPDSKAARISQAATLDYEWIEAPRRLISLPGEPLGPAKPILIG